MKQIIQCPSCSGSLEVEPSWADQQLECPLCAQPFISPQFSPSVATALPPSRHDQRVEKVRLWNPNVATAWGLLLGPAFGPLIHYLNWKTMGNSERAQVSITWFCLALVLILVTTVGGLFSKEIGQIGLIAVLGFLIVWRLCDGKKQISFVEIQCNDQYAKRSWVLPVILGLAFQAVLGAVAGGGGELLRQQMVASKAVEIANDVLTRSQVDSSIRCIKVQIDAVLADGIYQGTAIFNIGVTAPIRIETQGDMVLASIDHAQLVSLQMGHAFNSALQKSVNDLK